MSLATDRVCSGVLFFLAEDRDRAWRLRRAHYQNDRGECAGCHTQTRPTVFPCIVRMLADDAIARSIPQQRSSDVVAPVTHSTDARQPRRIRPGS